MTSLVSIEIAVEPQSAADVLSCGMLEVSKPEIFASPGGQPSRDR